MALILGISEVHLGRLAKAGTVPPAEARGEWDVVAVVQAMLAHERNKVAGGDEETAAELKSEELRLLTARRRRAEANATADEIATDIALRAVVHVEVARGAMASFCGVLKSGLANAAFLIAGRAATMTAAPEIQDMAQAEFNRSFESARAELRALWHLDEPDQDGASEQVEIPG